MDALKETLRQAKQRKYNRYIDDIIERVQTTLAEYDGDSKTDVLSVDVSDIEDDLGINSYEDLLHDHVAPILEKNGVSWENDIGAILVYL